MWHFFKDFMVYGFASVISKIAAIFLMPVYTNILTREEYGAMALITSCQGIIGLISNLNIHSGVARDYYETGIDRKKLVSTGFFSILCISTIILLLMVLTRNFWAVAVLGLQEKYMFAFIIMLCSIPTASLMSYFSILTRFKKTPQLYALGVIIQLIIQIGISVYGVAVLRAGILSIFVGVLIGEIIAACFFAFINKEFISFTFNKTYIKRALLFSIPTLPAILAGWVDSSMGQILIGKNVSMTDLGVYSVSLSLASVFTLISTAFQNVWQPFLYENYKKDDFEKNIRNLFSTFMIVLIIICVSLSLFSREIVLLLSNPSYLDACKYITLLCIPMSFYLMFPFASSGVSVSRDTKYIAISYVAGSMGNLILLFLTLPYLGVISVPICLGVSRIVTYLILYKVSEKKISYHLPNYQYIFLCLGVLVCYYLLILNLSIVLRIFLVLIFYSSIFLYARNRISMSLLLHKIRNHSK